MITTDDLSSEFLQRLRSKLDADVYGYWEAADFLISIGYNIKMCFQIDKEPTNVFYCDDLPTSRLTSLYGHDLYSVGYVFENEKEKLKFLIKWC